MYTGINTFMEGDFVFIREFVE